MALTIEQVTSILQGSAGQIQEYANQVSPAYLDIRAGIEQAGQAQARAAEAAGVIATQEAKATQLAQQQSLTAASALGSNMADAAPLTIELQRLLSSNVRALNEQQAKVAQMESNNDLFTNPLGFIEDLLFGDGERSKRDALAQSVDTASKSLQSINQATQQTTATNLALRQTQTDATILAVQEQSKAEIDRALGETRARLGTTRVQELEALKGFSSAASSQYLQAFNAQAADEQRQFMREQRLQAAEDRKEARAADENLLAIRNAGAQALGLPTVTNLQGWKTSIQLNKDREDMLILQGQRVSRGGTPQIAGNPIEAMQVANQLGVPLSAPQQQLVKKTQLLTSGITEERIAQLYPDLKRNEIIELRTDKKRQGEILNRHMTQSINEMRTVIDPQSPNNLYAPASIGTLADRTYMNQNPFLREYILPTATTSPDTAIDGGQYAEFAMDAIKKGMSTADIVDGITFIGTQMVNQNNLTYNYGLLGLPHQESLRIPVLLKGQGFFASGSGINEVVDLTNRTDVSRLVTKAQSELVKRERNVNSGGSTLRGMFP